MIDKEGNIYTSAQAGVFVFSPEGKVVQSYLGKDYSNIHDMKIRQEGNAEFIYGARNQDAEGIKFNAASGEIVLRLKFPPESKLDLKKFNPLRSPWRQMTTSFCPTVTPVTTSSSMTRQAST